MTTTSLQKMFERQAELQKMFGYEFEKMTVIEKEQLTKDMVLYLLEETHELLRETNFKTHKKVRKEVNRDNIKEELSDILHFFINLCLVWDVSVENLEEAFFKKNKKNVARISNSKY